MGENGWELYKENIQPLSSGRKMSMLTNSLDGSEYEKAVLQRQRKLEEEIVNYQGSDPLEPWLQYIKFMEQSCPSGGSTKYDSIVGRCCQTFYNDPEYKNDKRFVDVYIKTMQKVVLDKRVQILQTYLDRGFGSKVSNMYISIAADYESLQNYPTAISVLKKGIDSDAEPIEDLKEALNNIEYRVAERVCKNIKYEFEEPLRNFGSGVPVCSYTNEAQNVRVALSPGFPTRAKPASTKLDKRKFPIFEGFGGQNENTEDNAEPLNLSSLPVPQVAMLRGEQENFMKPSRWCDEVFSAPPTTFSNPDPIQIYEEEPETQPSLANVSRKISKGVLSERKLETPSTDPEETPLPVKPPTIQKIMYRKDQLKKGDREITFEHLRAKEFLEKRGLNTVRALLCAEKKIESTAVQKQQQQNLENERARNKEVELEKENQFLKNKLQDYQKAIDDHEGVKKNNSELIEQQNQTIIQVQNALREVHKSSDEMKQYFQLRVKELENTIDQEQEILFRTREESKELQNALNNEMEKVQILLNEKEQMRQQFEDEKLKMQQCFDRERNESLLNFSARLEHSIARQEMEQENRGENKTTQQKRNSTKSSASPLCLPVSQSTTAPKLPFNLYESNMDMVENNEMSFVRPSLKASNPMAGSSISHPPSTASQSTNIPQQKLPFNFYDRNTEMIENDENWCARPTARVTSFNPSGMSSLPMSEPALSTQKLPFSLYESNMEMIDNIENSFARPVVPRPPSSGIGFNVFNDENRPQPTGGENEPPASRNFMPPPPPKARNFEEDKENLGGFQIEKRKRVKSGILQPSTTADPMELIYTEEEGGDQDQGEDDVVKRQEDYGADFNVTDLTRALEFFPKPLVNSTPDKKTSYDVTCQLPPPRNPLRASRKSSLFKTFDLPGPGPYQEMPQRHHGSDFVGLSSQATQSTAQDPFPHEMQPIVYEDEINFNAQKDNSYSGKLYGQSFAQAENLLHNLSPIPETSKERWSGTSSSSSNNTTSTRGAVNYSTMSSYNVTKSVPRPIGRFPGH